MSLELFQVLDWINQKTRHPDPEELEEYGGLSYIINRMLSKHTDSVLFANEMNMSSRLPGFIQFDFYFYGLSKRFRRASKKVVVDETKVDMIKKVFGYSSQKAKEAIPIIDGLNIWKEIEEYLDVGGLQKRKKP